METEIPKLGFVPMIDAETNELIWVDTSSKRLRENYNLNYADSVKYFETLFNKNGAGVGHILTLTYRDKLIIGGKL